MTTEQQQAESVFIVKQSSLQLALDRIKSKLESFSSESDPEKLKWWNNWHDLQMRIEDRLWDNWKAYKEWHWDTFNFNTY